MMTDHVDVIAAFVDNEPVRAGDLAAALAGSLGREYLIDLLVLRGLVGDASVRIHGAPGLPWPERSRGQSRGQTARTTGLQNGATGLQSRGRALWLTAAAALVAISVGTGFLAGRVMNGGVSTDSGSASDVAEPAGSSIQRAPTPTHVIRMEKGVDWNERSGGN